MKRPKQKRHPLYPEPGASVLDNWHGLPKLEPPESLPKEGKILSYEIRDQWIAYEGLGACLFLIPTSKIKDIALQFLWVKAQRAMTEIVGYLETVQEPRTDKRKVSLRKAPKRRAGGAELIGDSQD